MRTLSNYLFLPNPTLSINNSDQDEDQNYKELKYENTAVVEELPEKQIDSFKIFDWKEILKSSLLSAAELILIAYSIKLFDQLYNDFNDNRDPTIIFFERFLPSALLAKILGTLNNYMITRSTTKKASELATKTLTVHFSLPYKYRKEESPQKAARLTFDAFDIIRPGLVNLHEKVIAKILEIFIYGGAIVFTKECQIIDAAAIGGGAFLVSLFGTYLLSKKISTRRQNYLNNYEHLYEHNSLIVNNYETVKVLGAENKIVDDTVEKLIEFCRNVNDDTHGFTFIVNIMDLLLFSIATFGSLVLSKYRQYRGDEFIYLFLYSIGQSKNFKDLCEGVCKFTQARLSFEEIQEYFKKQRPFIGQSLSDLRNETKAKNVIEFKNVNFGHLYIDHLTIPLGSRVEISGPSGCGKSTILKLLARINELDSKTDFTSEIKIAGHDLAKIDNLSRFLSYIHAETQIFPFSLKENISIADSSLPHQDTHGRIQSAAKNALIEDKVNNPDYENPEMVAALSTGQKKRVGLARLFYKPTDILLLDEPLSGLDILTANAFLENLNRLIVHTSKNRKKTIFVVEHKQEFKTNDKMQVLFNSKITFFNDGNIKFKTVNSEKIIGRWKELKASDSVLLFDNKNTIN